VLYPEERLVCEGQHSDPCRLAFSVCGRQQIVQKRPTRTLSVINISGRAQKLRSLRFSVCNGDLRSTCRAQENLQ
jgi:hypothetical protein